MKTVIFEMKIDRIGLTAGETLIKKRVVKLKK